MEFQVYSRAVKLLFAVLLLTTSPVLAHVGADTIEHTVNDNDGTTTSIDPMASTVQLAPPALEYSGSESCAPCHASQHDKWTHSGHPYQLALITGNEAPVDSFPIPSAFASNPTDPPVGTTWSDFSYTIGGYGWKMRWMQTDGYIYTPASGLNQFNFEDETWRNYHAGELKPYNCGGCHTTGWVDSDDGIAENNQGGMEGLLGTFFAGGVTCESCHGMGSLHVYDPPGYSMTVDNSSYFCGKCHTRGGDNGVTPGETIIEASGGFVKYHEQYDEWFHSPHNVTAGPGCVTCHDPHASVKFDDSAPGEGVRPTASCGNCHNGIITPNHVGVATCIDCHMPDASKNAIKNNIHNGDTSTHLWSINTSVNGKVDMFSADGTAVALDGNGHGAITLDFACYGCHQDDNGNGGTGSMKTMQQLADRASDIHGTLSGVDQDQVPTIAVLKDAYPNPFNPQTTIAFDLPTPMAVSLRVTDMSGRLVRVLIAGEIIAEGRQEAIWNGRDDTGRRVASGTYFYRLEAGEYSETKRMALIK